MGTNFGPEEMARISCEPYGEISVPNLASISIFVLLLLLLLLLVRRRAIDRDWIKNNLIASSGWVGRERNGFRDDDAEVEDAPDGRSADDLFASFDDWATRLPSAPAGRLLDDMLLLKLTSTS